MHHLNAIRIELQRGDGPSFTAELLADSTIRIVTPACIIEIAHTLHGVGDRETTQISVQAEQAGEPEENWGVDDKPEQKESLVVVVRQEPTSKVPGDKRDWRPARVRKETA